MNNIISAAVLAFATLTAAQAAEHHSGHGASLGGSSGGTCMKPKLAKFSPEHLATVAPGSDISFVALNINHPSQISVTVKEIPVATVAEFKDPFYLVKAKLPAGLRNTAARITIKINAKSSHCEAEGGWLVKISG